MNVVVCDDPPADDITEDDLFSDDFTGFGSVDEPVEEGETIKIKPEGNVPGRFIIIFVPGEGHLSLGDVKVYVRPVAEPEEPEEPTEVVVLPAPGEPGGPNGPEGPEGPGGPDGPEEVDTSVQPSGGSSGENPENGNDGNPDTCFTSDEQLTPWWSLDLGKQWEIVAIHVVACSNDRKY